MVFQDIPQNFTKSFFFSYQLSIFIYFISFFFFFNSKLNTLLKNLLNPCFKKRKEKIKKLIALEMSSVLLQYFSLTKALMKVVHVKCQNFVSIKAIIRSNHHTMNQGSQSIEIQKMITFKSSSIIVNVSFYCWLNVG